MHSYWSAWARLSRSEVRLKPLYESRHLLEEPEGFLILTGEEIDVLVSGGQYWINAINLAQAIPPQPRQQTGVEAMRATVQAGDRCDQGIALCRDSYGAQFYLAEVEGVEATYEFSGAEFYVRALVMSDQPHPNPTVPGDVMKAWTQPVVPEPRKP